MKLPLIGKHWWTVAVSLLVALMMLLAAAVVFAPHLGWRIDNVLSGSMSPGIKVGSAVITQPVDTGDIEVGDIITFRSPRNGEMITHRVIAIEGENIRYFQTKGDANEDPDPYTVPVANVEGRVIFDVPLLGYFADFVKTPLGFILVLGVPGTIIILLEFRKMWIELSEEEKRKKAGKMSVKEGDK
jgi:signal peptidase